MPLVTLDNIDKSFGVQRLFAGVSFALDVRDHAVLVGPNGSGKTTLLRLIAGTEQPDVGRIARARGRRIWMHEQTPELSADRPVRDYLTDAFGELVALEHELRRVEEQLAALREDSPELRDTMRAYQHLQRRFETGGGYHERASLDNVLEGLGLSSALLERDLLQLSGGELTRVTLARALLAEADLLLLDEPTNHLDIDSVEWLETFLAEYPGAFVLVTHDRRLLEQVGSRVLALEGEHVEALSADFATYLREREAAIDLTAKRYDQDLEKIEQLQRFYDRFHAKKDKAKEAKAKLTQIERLKRDLAPPRRPARKLHLGLPQPRPSSRVVLEVRAPRLVVGSEADAPTGASTAAPATGPTAACGPRVLVRNLDVVVERGEKIALVGPNGSGKTTLVETVAGLRSLGGGAVHIGHNVRPAYFSQQGRELDPEDTALETVLPLVGHDEQTARALLGRFLFGGDDAFKRVGSLSGGERSRLRLLTLLVGEANFLLLDEPTNHLDMDSVDALGVALRDYSATLLFVTHDRHLIDTVATRVLEIHGGRLVTHLSAERYWEARAARRSAGEVTSIGTPGSGGGGRPAGGATGDRATPALRTASAPSQAGGGRPANAEEARRRRARIRGVESQILKLERRLGDIDAELTEPATYDDRRAAAALAAERAEADGRLQQLYEEWEGAVDDVAE